MKKNSHISQFESVNFNFDDKKNIFDKLKNIIFDDHKVLIAVSWWADSMFTSVLMLKYYLENGLDLANLYFIHCNHAIRPESEDEEEFIQQFFLGTDISICNKPSDWLDNSEKGLRERRYSQIQKIIESEWIDYVVFGHNLTDRVESSFLHMFRGAWLKWFMSMNYLDTNHLIPDVKIIRPLVQLTKNQIFQLCEQFDIQYFQDISNDDSSVSRRNHLRNEILPDIYAQSHYHDDYNNTFLESMKNIYSELENIAPKSNIILEPINLCPYWEADFGYIREIKKSTIESSHVVELLHKLWIYNEIWSGFIDELTNFLSTKDDGYKYFNNTYFFIAHGDIYIIKAPEFFWQKDLNISLDIKETWEIIFDWLYLDIDEKWIWATVRYPKEWDQYKSKNWNKYCINQKIPIFWRHFVPIAVKDWKIIKSFEKYLNIK